LIEQINPGLIQIAVGSRISNILGQYCKWPNDIVDSNGQKIGGVLVEMDSVSENLRIGIGINRFNHQIGDLIIRGWKEYLPELELDELFSIIDAELSTLFEEHPLLENKFDIDEIISESWRILSRLMSRGYTLNMDGISSRITALETDGYLTIISDNHSRNIHDIDTLEWLF
jgi:biotin-(acetyl-CoA carboxylase) ligase